MTLFLLRHGIAEDASETGRDEDRKLTDEGRDKLSMVLERAAKAGVKPGVILSSPFKRAMQTARLAASVLNAPEPVKINSVVPHGSPRGFWNDLQDYRTQDEVMVASHEPFLSSAIAYLLDSPSLSIEVKKGSITAIGFEHLRGEPQGILRWMLTPRLCQ